ncbi:HAD family hydrolase [Aquihabitans sp. G128]|uniref:HAD family hydrolase n=1 Tax=Aquihabitans sp. G128 TaxID=2849779 RepID=UPI001C23BA7A|nr:HAD family hydrolase [Aquihabitans sp. G128]QXC60872.1 HAD family hydrolase [Aquihabitans sp. G128]
MPATGGPDADVRPGVLLDVDGTLLDTNHLHTLAWFRAFRRFDQVHPMHEIHRLVGMGGDKLVPELAGEEVDGLEDAYGEEFDRLFDDVTLLPGARELVQALHDVGLRLVLASSAKEEDLDRFREVLDVDRWLAGWTSSGDADASKPESDIFDVAIERFALDRARTIAIGDATWDAKAAGRAGVGFVGVATGGTAAADLVDAGASRAYDDADALVADLHRGPFAAIIPDR